MNAFDNVIDTVSDLDAAKAIHTALLDTESHTDRPYHVGFNIDGVEIVLCLESRNWRGRCAVSGSSCAHS
jgi:tRNA threonylcarbamoyladenosine modification (KEOPS) complex  Pcc1 subunit